VRALLILLVVVGLLAAVGGWLLTEPRRADAAAILAGDGDAANGRLIFIAGGCASCHSMPNQPDGLLLGGGLGIESPFGTFTVPNISPDPRAGIGAWSEEQFVTALTKGVSPANEHYFPAFPYIAYRRAAPADLRDLFAYLKTLPPSANAPPGHDLAFPFSVRRGVGIWKQLHMKDAPPLDPGTGDPLARGRYLVEALGHCAECHSPRDITGGIVASRRYGGGPSPDGKGRMPNITPGQGGISDWSEDDIAFALADGTTPDGDVLGGDMARVVKNTAQLPEDDRRAIAVYLKSLPPVDDAPAAAR